MADVIKFDFDVPVEIALRFNEPKIVQGSDKYPGAEERHMYSTTDGRVMFLTPLASARVKALHLAQGEFFFICKRKIGRITEYEVTRETMESAEPPAPAARRTTPAPHKTSLPDRLYYKPAANGQNGHESSAATFEEQLQASIDMVRRRKAGEQEDGTFAVPAVPAPRPAVQEMPQQSKAAERLAPAVAEFSSRLTLEANALVDIYASVLKSASERYGNAVKPEDVRSLVVTCYINASKSRPAA